MNFEDLKNPELQEKLKVAKTPEGILGTSVSVPLVAATAKPESTCRIWTAPQLRSSGGHKL